MCAAVWAILVARFSLLCAVFAAKSQPHKRLSDVKKLLYTEKCNNLSQNVPSRVRGKLEIGDQRDEGTKARRDEGTQAGGHEGR